MSDSCDNESLRGAFDRHLGIHRDERKAAAAMLRELAEDVVLRASQLAGETTFHTRRYGKSDFYCWPQHPLFEADPVSPWPAARYPKDVLRVELVIRDERQKRHPEPR